MRAKDIYKHHNRISLIQSGKAYFDLLLQLIEKAQETIYIQVYIYDDDQTGAQVSAALRQAAKRGVKVFLLVDGFGIRMSNDFVKELCAAGVHFRRFYPMFSSKHFYLGRRLHNKLVVTDSVHALLGGRNIADYYNDLPGQPAWLDMALYIEGETSADLEKLCISMWNTVFGRGIKATATDAAIIQERLQALDIKDKCLLRVRRNDWVRGKTEILNSYYHMLATAREEIVILGSYFLPGLNMRKKLEKAADRNIKVKVVLTGVSDVWLAKYAERYLYNWMVRKNIEVYEYNRNVMHAKVVVADNNLMTIGSFNVNNISAHVSVELNVDVHDQQFVTKVQAELNDIINKDCTRVTKPDFSFSLNLFKRFTERVAYETVRLMLYVVTFYYKRGTPKTEAAEYKY